VTGLAFLVAGAAVVYAVSEYRLRRHYDLPVATMPLPVAPPDLELGRRRAISLGCYDGCHGPGGRGDTWNDDPWFSVHTTPNLTELLPSYSDGELARLIRRGIRRDGTTAVDMPSAMFYHLSDGDLASVVAFLRTLSPQPGLERQRHFGPLGRWELATGRWVPSADDVRAGRPPAGQGPLRTAAERGRYIVMITCTECHGQDLGGMPGYPPPPLAIVAAYSFDEFSTLLRTGIAKGGRELELMSMIGRTRGAALSDEEVADLYTYLRSRLDTEP
jgi:mono/diheme cytochrome c family protein